MEHQRTPPGDIRRGSLTTDVAGPDLDGRVLAVVAEGGTEPGGRVGVSSMTITARLAERSELEAHGARAVLDGRKTVQGALRRLRERGLVESPQGTGVWHVTDAGRAEVAHG